MSPGDVTYEAYDDHHSKSTVCCTSIRVVDPGVFSFSIAVLIITNIKMNVPINFALT